MADSTEKYLTLAQVQKLAEDKDKCLMIINNKVYDVTKFIDEHPGGEEVLKEQHGRNASNAFEDVGHSSDAREQMKTYEIADLHPDDVKKPAKAKPLIVNGNETKAVPVEWNSNGSWLKMFIPLVIVVVAILYFRLSKST